MTGLRTMSVTSGGTAFMLAVTAVFAVILLLPGIVEKRKNERNVRSIPVRINVNGTRGKSTAVRLITAVLREAGYRTAGKTTGTAARMLHCDGTEESIKRPPKGVSIGEQLKVIAAAASENADALVCECMAVRPENQKAVQHEMLKAGITVIVNVLEDHLMEMGPGLDQIAWAFAETIPYEGKAVIPDCEYTDYFRRIAEERGTEVYIIDDSEITQEYLDRFGYLLFDHNCATALAVSRALGIDDETAFRGMLKAVPDPGTVSVRRLKNGAVFANAFAANEPSSTLEIWKKLQNSDVNCEEPIVVMNCRAERVDRTRLFIEEFLPLIPEMTLLAIGEKAGDCINAFEQGRLPNCREFRCIEGHRTEKVMEYLEPVMAGRLIFGVGNIHGEAVPFIDAVTADRR